MESCELQNMFYLHVQSWATAFLSGIKLFIFTALDKLKSYVLQQVYKISEFITLTQERRQAAAFQLIWFRMLQKYTTNIF